MRKVIKVLGMVIGFAALAALLALRVAIAAVLAIVTPIVMPILALLSGGGLLVAIGFACFGYWYDAAKGLWACLLCSGAFALIAGLTMMLNPLAFSDPVTTTNGHRRM